MSGLNWNLNIPIFSGGNGFATIPDIKSRPAFMDLQIPTWDEYMKSKNQISLGTTKLPNFNFSDTFLNTGNTTQQTKNGNEDEQDNSDKDENASVLSGFGKFLKGSGSMIGNALAGIGNSFAKDSSQFTSSQATMQDTARNIIGSFGLTGAALSATTGFIDMLGSVTDSNLSTLDPDAAKEANIGGYATFSNIINHLPGLSAPTYVLGKSIFGGGKSQNFKKSQLVESLSDTYSGSIADLDAAEEISGKNYFGRWARRRANRYINDAKETNRILADIGRTNTMRKQSDYYQDLSDRNYNKYAGTNYINVQVGKNGFKLKSVEEIRAMLSSPVKLQNGGTIPGIDTSIIPEGALHKELNHLDKANPDLEDVTKKGIPVVTANEGGKIGEQIAEVEHSEIIFRKSITDELERLKKDGSEEAMIEAGKLIANELILNTEDNSGLLEKETGNE